jgi:hypothetical protein
MKQPLKFQLSPVLKGQNGNSTVMGTTRLRQLIVLAEAMESGCLMSYI